MAHIHSDRGKFPFQIGEETQSFSFGNWKNTEWTKIIMQSLPALVQLWRDIKFSTKLIAYLCRWQHANHFIAEKLSERLGEREENPAFKSLLLFHGSRTPRNVLFWANANGNYAEKYKHKQLVMHINRKNWKQLSVSVFQCFLHSSIKIKENKMPVAICHICNNIVKTSTVHK